MGIRYIPGRRYTDPQERLDYQGLDLLANGRAIIEPDSLGLTELNEDDVIAALGFANTDSNSGTVTITETTSVPAAGSAILSDYFTLGGEVPLDSVVICRQHAINNYFTGFVETTPDGTGGLIYRVRFAVKNFSNISRDVNIGDIIAFSIFSFVEQPIPRTPNAELVVTPGQVWIDPDTGENLDPLVPVLQASMNNTARPQLSVAPGSITFIELNGEAIANFGALYTGRRAVFTVPSNTPVPIGDATLLGSVTFVGSVGPYVICGQPNPTPLFTGLVSGTSILVYARNNSFNTLNVPAGTQIKLFAYS